MLPPRKIRQFHEAVSRSPFCMYLFHEEFQNFSFPFQFGTEESLWSKRTKNLKFNRFLVLDIKYITFKWKEQNQKSRKGYLKLFMIFHCCILVLPYTLIRHLPLLYSNYRFLEAETCQCFRQ